MGFDSRQSSYYDGAAMMDTMHLSPIGLIAGEGHLPLHVAENAFRQGRSVVAFCIGRNNVRELQRLCVRTHRVVPGLLERNVALFKSEGVRELVFAGKVNKWLLLCNPRLDAMALKLMRQAVQMNDDRVMLGLIDYLAGHGLTVLRQVDFLQNLFVSEGILTQQSPNERQWLDIRYGFSLAKALGRLDVGQSVLVKDGMVLAVEAIEGTDRCIQRAGDLARRKGGVLIKVAKPEQDPRFDVPTVGLRTLKTMKKMGIQVLATEASRTLFLEQAAMVSFADRHGLSIVSVDGARLPGGAAEASAEGDLFSSDSAIQGLGTSSIAERSAQHMQQVGDASLLVAPEASNP
ncbi:MAG: UDP-2,3-diacylglucosamine diphosphatase LpxI [Candidatus Melainabacteria bacterium]|nr:UDP-2,3-diacylglucosamine diphosphatase LpxI [Candidatus Melainabacteria bacterium]